MRFFYCVTLHQPQMELELPATKVTYKLPEILDISEVQTIIKAAAGNIMHKTLLMVAYSAGLRVSEVVRLKPADISRARMTLHIRDTKNSIERYVILSPVVLEQLDAYWRHCKFKDYIFPGKKDDGHITTSVASYIYYKAKETAGIKKPGGIHGLRHAYATHSLESGTDLFRIKVLLGHKSIHSTVRYLSFSPNKDSNIKSPIDQLSL